MDNNQSLNAIAGCTYPNGSSGTNCFQVTRIRPSLPLSPCCLQVGYTSNVFSVQCAADDGHCGTYLEIHIPHGTPYETDENAIIAEVKIDQRNVSGFYTTIMVSH